MADQHETPLASALLEEESESQFDAPKSGFLPIETNAFDRLFISVVIWIAMSLFWFRFLEPMGLSIWICNAIAVGLAFFIIKKG